MGQAAMEQVGDGKPKLLGLEAARAVCAFAVLMWHYSHFYTTPGSVLPPTNQQPLYALLRPFYEFGEAGVYVFWAISGFIFFWKYGAAIAAREVSAGRFFWLRVSRLYPLHLVTLLAVAALQPCYVALVGSAFAVPDNSLPLFLAQLVMASHWLGGAPFSFNAPSWSISAEVAVYAGFFLVVRRFGAGIGVTAAIAMLSLAALVWGMGWPVIACAAFFFAGGGAAHWFGHAEANGSQRVGACLILIVLVTAGAYSGWLSDRALLPFVLLFAVVPGLFLAAQDWAGLHRFARPLRTAGNLTYASYMIHFPLQLIVAIAAAASGQVLPVPSPWFLFAYLGVTMVLAHQVHRRFERPMQDWLRALTLSPRRTAAA